MLPTPFLDSLAGLPGFDKNAFAQVHAQGEQITSVRLNKYKPFSQAATTKVIFIILNFIPLQEL